MNAIIELVKKDLLRDAKHPVGLLIQLSIPVMLATMMALVFAPSNEDDAPRITIHVALLDQDEEMIGGFFRSISNQGEGDQQIQVHMVETLDEGIALLENRKVSALLTLPENLTSDLINGGTAVIGFYPNPAELFMPRIIEQGTGILTVSASELLDLVGDELKEAVDMFEGDDFPGSWQFAMMAYRSMQKMEAIETYVFPPIIQMRTTKASDYIPLVSRTISAPGEKASS